MVYVVSAFLLLAASILIIVLTLDSSEAVGSPVTFLSISAPVAALVPGVLGLIRFAQDDYGLEDRFNSMNLLLALGLIVLTLAEIGTGIISGMPSGQEFYFTISLLLIPGILLWGIGTTRYLIVCRSTITGVKPKKILLVITLVSVSGALLTQIFGAIISPGRTLINIAVCIPVGFGILMIVGVFAVLLWTFRSGLFVLPFGLSFIASLLFVIQYYSWCVLSIAPISIFSRLIATEVYILMGGSVSIAGRLEAAN